MSVQPPRLLLRRLLSARLVRFAAVGFSGVFVNLGLLFLLADVLHIADVLSSAAAIEVSILWNFALNNAVTFADRNQGASAGLAARLWRYNLVGLVGLGIQLGTFVLLCRAAVAALQLPAVGLWKYPSQAAGIGIAMGWNFFTNFYWTWRQQEAGAEAAQGQSRAGHG